MSAPALDYTVVVGFEDLGEDGYHVLDSARTRTQVEAVVRLPSALADADGPVAWEACREMLEHVVRDRTMRVDQNTLMADRPPGVVITVRAGRAIRLEYYAGHDSLALVHDIRAPELQGQKLQRFLARDDEYSPEAYLAEAMPRMAAMRRAGMSTFDAVRALLREQMGDDERVDGIARRLADAIEGRQGGH